MDASHIVPFFCCQVCPSHSHGLSPHELFRFERAISFRIARAYVYDVRIRGVYSGVLGVRGTPNQTQRKNHKKNYRKIVVYVTLIF